MPVIADIMYMTLEPMLGVSTPNIIASNGATKLMPNTSRIDNNENDKSGSQTPDLPSRIKENTCCKKNFNDFILILLAKMALNQ
jgi:hypothetical protein